MRINRYTKLPDSHSFITYLTLIFGGADEHVTIRMEFNATGSGEFLGYDVDGKEVNASEIYLFGVSDGQLAEYWYNWDELGFWEQFGVVESPYPEE